ncbi:MAG: alpha/beta fold hydrolase [Ferrovibrio sp.]|uniref:alpha/beta hydrolase n=1 Tax=Ferrovibrio sp. TaxID=1917215 RepID=UPI002605E5D2|nr:alpha/beta fold hydrolase [Ferrovibrio sp.]MCW0236211.1 alpha/beta fold hydrolase [Ferrovibrio sp.]
MITSVRVSHVNKSTNVRSIIELLLQRSLIRAGFRLAPGWAADRAAGLFLRPWRRPGPGRSRYVSRETPFAAESALGPVAAWSFGPTARTAPAILLVHGWEDDHLSWAPLIDRLVQRGYRVLALDLPGHGRSPADITGIPILAAGVAAVGREAETIGAVSADRPFKAVIAHSLGGTATLIAATELGLRAERYAILAAPNHPRLFAGAMMQMLGLSRQQTATVFTAIERLIGRTMDSLYLPPKLRQLAVPGLILHSREDRTVPLQHSQENAAAWRRAEFRILDGLGHRRLMTDEAVHSMLLHFIDSTAPVDAYGPKSDAAD